MLILLYRQRERQKYIATVEMRELHNQNRNLAEQLQMKKTNKTVLLR